MSKNAYQLGFKSELEKIALSRNVVLNAAHTAENIANRTRKIKLPPGASPEALALNATAVSKATDQSKRLHDTLGPWHGDYTVRRGGNGAPDLTRSSRINPITGSEVGQTRKSIPAGPLRERLNQSLGFSTKKPNVAATAGGGI